MNLNRLRKKLFLLSVSMIVIVLIQACQKYYFRSNYRNANELLHETENILSKPYLKAHLLNGEVCILMDTWKIDPDQETLSGSGSRYDFNRNKISEGQISIPVSDVAIFETNQKIKTNESPRVTALTLLAGADIIIGIICITNPKACFGSCPTFYLNENENIHYADAEGFSNAVSPSLEYSDIDALKNHYVNGDNFSIYMKNEALETHCVNELQLVAFPVSGSKRIYQSTHNKFYLCENNYSLSHATGPEGDITSLLENEDKVERTSPADDKNLNSKEEIFLSIENVKDQNDLGLVLSYRQTLMTTYFIYSAMGYGGDEVGEIFAEIERSDKTKNMLKTGIGKELGDIDIYSWDESNGKWEFQGGFNETGPIAYNRQILPIANTFAGDKVKMKIVLNKGLWSLDNIALTNIRKTVEPEGIMPSVILKNGVADSIALSNIKSPDKYLISMPGDIYRIDFNLPDDNKEYELFLRSKGYYLEWMRENWMKEKNLLKLRQMIHNPGKYLKKEAKPYKLYEKTMIQEFWNSKISTKSLSYNEN